MTQPPKKGEAVYWILGLLATAVSVMAGALAWQDRVHREELAKKDAIYIELQEARTKDQAEFRSEIGKLYLEVRDFREEIYQASLRQQKLLKRK